MCFLVKINFSIDTKSFYLKLSYDPVIMLYFSVRDPWICGSSAGPSGWQGKLNIYQKDVMDLLKLLVVAEKNTFFESWDHYKLEITGHLLFFEKNLIFGFRSWTLKAWCARRATSPRGALSCTTRRVSARYRNRPSKRSSSSSSKLSSFVSASRRRRTTSAEPTRTGSSCLQSLGSSYLCGSY